MDLSDDVKLAHQKAVEIREHAHAPYSNFKVAAAVKLAKVDEPILGFNIENGSYGGTVCAERVAIFSAISQHLTKDFQFIVIVTEAGQPPCGFCLQVMAEFFDAETPVYLADPHKITAVYKFSDLLPVRFEFQ